VPVAFIPGISGQLFRQFAVAVSVSMLISAINALTLSPALCSVLLRPGHITRGPMRHVMNAIDYTRDGYAAMVRRLVRVAVLSLAILAAVVVASGGLFTLTPTGFLPEEDQGAIFAVLQLPEGASQNRTAEMAERAEAIMQQEPDIAGLLTVVGYDFINAVAASNKAFFVAQLKPYAERPEPSQSAGALIERLRREFATMQGAIALPLNLPPIIGLGTTGGFQ
jgi:HAE1 family hydrophobic/amphiphilic exporter-1